MNYIQKIEAVMREIAPHLTDRFDPETYARNLLEYADEDQYHFEIRGLHTKSGNPHSFWLVEV